MVEVVTLSSSSSDEDDDPTPSTVPPQAKRRRIIVSDSGEDDDAKSEDIDDEEEDEDAEDEDADEEGSGQSSSASGSGEDDDDEDEDESESDEDSILSLDSELSWNEFGFLAGDGGDATTGDAFVSPEAEEESLRVRYNEAMRLLLNEQPQQGYDALLILLAEPLIQRQQVPDFAEFDWTKAKAGYSKICESRLRMIAYGIHRALARLVDKPTFFYLQALALRPTDRALWYEFAFAAARLHDWKVAEMALNECRDDPNTIVHLAELYFYSGNYAKCVPVLREILAKKPQNLTALVLKAEIAKKEAFWRWYVDLYFPTNPNPLLPPPLDPPPEIRQRILAEIRSFADRKPPSVAYESAYSITDLTHDHIKLNVEQSVEAYSALICTLFDQVTKQQLPFTQKFHFVRQRKHPRHTVSSLASDLYSTGLKSSDIIDLTCDESQMVADEDSQTTVICRDVINHCIDVIEASDDMVNRVTEGRVPKNRSNKNAKKRSGRKSRRELSLDVRRSTRLTEDIPLEALTPPGCVALPSSGANVMPVTIRTLLGLPPGDSTFPPLDFPGTSRFPLDDIDISPVESQSLSSLRSYLVTVINAGSMTLEQVLFSFLSFIATSLPDGCRLSPEHAKRYLEVYIRWVTMFRQPLEVSTADADVKEIAVHLMALELDVDEKLPAVEACLAIFDNPLGIGRLPVEAEIEAAPSSQASPVKSKLSMRSRALEYLKNADPDMYRHVKAQLDVHIRSTKTVARDDFVEAAVDAANFVQDRYRPRRAQPKKDAQKPQTSNVGVSEVTKDSGVDGIDDSAVCDDTKLLDDSGLVVSPPAKSLLAEEEIVEFTLLWGRLRQIADQLSKKKPVAKSNSQLPEILSLQPLSPLPETPEDAEMGEEELLSTLAAIGAGEEDEEVDAFVQSFSQASISNPDLPIGQLVRELITKMKNFLDNDFSDAQALDFLSELKSVGERLKNAISKAAERKNRRQLVEGWSQREQSELQTLIARYLWLRVIRAPPADDGDSLAGIQARLATLITLLAPSQPVYGHLADDDSVHAVVTLKEVLRRLTLFYRKAHLDRIHALFEAGDYEQVISVLTTDFNWNGCSDSGLSANLALLLAAFAKTQDRSKPVIWLCRMLDRVIAGGAALENRDSLYNVCLEQLGGLDFKAVERDTLRLLAERMVVCAEYDRFKRNVNLWATLYRVVEALEEDYPTDDDRLEMYLEIEGYKLVMPTKALCILAEGHRVLGDAKCCNVQNGKLLYLIIDEVFKVCTARPFTSEMHEHATVRLIQRNVEIQLIQCLHCLFDHGLARTVVTDHGESLGSQPTIDIASKVVPLLVPNLPMFDDDKFVTNDVIETLTRVFGFIEKRELPGFTDASARLDAQIKNPPDFRFIKAPGGGLLVVGDVEAAASWPCVPVDESSLAEVKLCAMMRYALLMIKYRKGLHTYKWEEIEQLRRQTLDCLVLAGPPERGILSVKIVHSLWAICAYTHTMFYCYMNDEELLTKHHSYCYMFKMAFLLYGHAFQLHLDIAGAYYQMNSRFRRLKRHLKDKFTPEMEVMRLREKLIHQCQLHLDAFRYRISLTEEYPKDISWLEPYFSGKIAEHNRLPAKEVFGHYYRCAMLMRAEEYTYPLRISKTSQENVEPLELHYRVHVYALKRLAVLEKSLALDPVTALAEAKTIRDYLRLFIGHFIFAKKPNQAPPPVIESTMAFVAAKPFCDFAAPDWEALAEQTDSQTTDDDVMILDSDGVFEFVSDVKQFVDYRVECRELCRRAFESITRRFAHYKSFFRLAELQIEDDDFSAALDTIWARLYRHKFTCFEHVTDIVRTDFERSGSFDFHLKKIVKLTIWLVFMQCKSLETASGGGHGVEDMAKNKVMPLLETIVKNNASKIHYTDDEKSALIVSIIDSLGVLVSKCGKNIDHLRLLRNKFLAKADCLLKSKRRPESDALTVVCNDCQSKIKAIEDVEHRIAAELRKRDEEGRQKLAKQLEDERRRQFIASLQLTNIPNVDSLLNLETSVFNQLMQQIVTQMAVSLTRPTTNATNPSTSTSGPASTSLASVLPKKSTPVAGAGAGQLQRKNAPPTAPYVVGVPPQQQPKKSTPVGGAGQHQKKTAPPAATLSGAPMPPQQPRKSAPPQPQKKPSAPTQKQLTPAPVITTQTNLQQAMHAAFQQFSAKFAAAGTPPRPSPGRSKTVAPSTPSSAAAGMLNSSLPNSVSLSRLPIFTAAQPQQPPSRTAPKTTSQTAALGVYRPSATSAPPTRPQVPQPKPPAANLATSKPAATTGQSVQKPPSKTSGVLPSTSAAAPTASRPTGAPSTSQKSATNDATNKLTPEKVVEFLDRLLKDKSPAEQQVYKAFRGQLLRCPASELGPNVQKILTTFNIDLGQAAAKASAPAKKAAAALPAKKAKPTAPKPTAPLAAPPRPKPNATPPVLGSSVAPIVLDGGTSRTTPRPGAPRSHTVNNTASASRVSADATLSQTPAPAAGNSNPFGVSALAMSATSTFATPAGLRATPRPLHTYLPSPAPSTSNGGALRMRSPLPNNPQRPAPAPKPSGVIGVSHHQQSTNGHQASRAKDKDDDVICLDPANPTNSTANQTFHALTTSAAVQQRKRQSAPGMSIPYTAPTPPKAPRQQQHHRVVVQHHSGATRDTVTTVMNEVIAQQMAKHQQQLNQLNQARISAAPPASLLLGRPQQHHHQSHSESAQRR